MFILIRLSQPSTVPLVLLVRRPVLLRAVRRPSTVGALELDVLALDDMRVSLRMARRAHGAGRELLDRLRPLPERRERRLRERVEEVVLLEHGLFRLSVGGFGRFFEEGEEGTCLCSRYVAS